MLAVSYLFVYSFKIMSMHHPIVATRIENSYRIWRRTDRDDRMEHMHDIETISENIASRKHIRDSEFETRKVFERETSNKNNENIVT